MSGFRASASRSRRSSRSTAESGGPSAQAPPIRSSVQPGREIPRKQKPASQQAGVTAIRRTLEPDALEPGGLAPRRCEGQDEALHVLPSRHRSRRRRRCGSGPAKSGDAQRPSRRPGLRLVLGRGGLQQRWPCRSRLSRSPGRSMRLRVMPGRSTRRRWRWACWASPSSCRCSRSPCSPATPRTFMTGAGS